MYYSFFAVDKWRKYRRIISQAFNVKFLEQLYSVFNEKHKTLVKNLRQNINSTRPFDLWDYIISTTFDTICREYQYKRCRTHVIYLFFKIYNACTLFTYTHAHTHVRVRDIISARYYIGTDRLLLLWNEVVI